MMNALLIEDQNSEENSKIYLIMLSLTIAELQGIIPKLMALQRRWFKHAKKDFERFASLGTKKIGTWPYLTLPWVTRCLNAPLCFISLLTFYFLRNVPFHPLPLLLKWTRLWTLTPQPPRLSSSQRGLFYSGGLCMAMENLSIALHRDTLRYAPTRGGNYKPKVRQFEVGDFVYLQWQPNDTLDISSDCTILRIKAIGPLGVLKLQGANRRTIRDHSKNCGLM